MKKMLKRMSLLLLFILMFTSCNQNNVKYLGEASSTWTDTEANITESDIASTTAVTEITASSGDPSSGSSEPLPQAIKLEQVNKISHFDDGQWRLNSAAGAATLSDDTGYCRAGTKSLKITVAEGKTGIIDWRGTAFETQNRAIAFDFYVEDKNDISTFYLYFGKQGVGLTDFVSIDKGRLVNGWNRYCFTYSGIYQQTPEQPVVDWIRIEISATEQKTLEISFDSIGYYENLCQRACLVITFDDACDGVWKYAKPIMDQYGFRGTIYTIRDLVGTNTFMTLDQLKKCYEDGWDISTHSQRALTSYTTREQIRNELLYNYEYLIENGFTRSAGHFASHEGKYNAMALEEIKQIFKTHRTTIFHYETIPLVDEYQIKNIGGNNGDQAYLKLTVDQMVAGKNLVVMNWHQIVDGESETDCQKETFEWFIAYVASQDIEVVTMSDLFG